MSCPVPDRVKSEVILMFNRKCLISSTWQKLFHHEFIVLHANIIGIFGLTYVRSTYLHIENRFCSSYHVYSDMKLNLPASLPEYNIG